MEIYNASLASVEFCIFNETDPVRWRSLYPGGAGWASIAPGQKISWNHENRDKVQFEFRFPNGKKSTYILNCAPGVTIRPNMVIFNRYEPPPPHFDVKREIKHIVVLMMENRSFDNILGWLYTSEGNKPQRNIPPASPPTFEGLVENKFWNSRYSPGSPRVYATRGVKPPINKQPNPNPKEEYPSFLEQMFGVPLGAWVAGHRPKLEKPNMGGFLESYAQADHKSPERIMESFSPEQLPVISQLAKQFAVCDRWFGSLPSETLPNRSFLHAGTSFGRLNNGDQILEDHDPVPNFAFYSDRRTMFDVLSEHAISWTVYADMLEIAPPPLNVLNLRPSLTSMQFWSVGRKISFARVGYFADFEKAAKTGSLPAYSFIEPSFLPPLTSDQHPGPFCDMAAGDDLIYRTYQAVSQGPGWPHTLLVILYDEHGGCYDHVPPPATAVAPDDSKPQFPLEGFSPFRQFGPRVPAVVVSPFIEPGTVFRAPQGQTEYDHTSVLSTVRDWIFRQGVPSAWLTSARVKAAPTLWPVLTRDTPRPAPAITRAIPKQPELHANAAAPLEHGDTESAQMTSLQLGLVIESQALQKLVNDSPSGAPHNIDLETWRKTVDAAVAAYRSKAKGAEGP
jgi:phospholipase C